MRMHVLKLISIYLLVIFLSVNEVSLVSHNIRLSSNISLEGYNLCVAMKSNVSHGLRCYQFSAHFNWDFVD